MKRRIDADLASNARKMRREPGEPELRLWQCLRASQTTHKFRRQGVIGAYIVDFLCPYNGLIVEVDDDLHNPVRDAERDMALQSLGYEVLRVSNADVMSNIEGVVDTIVGRAAGLPERLWATHPNPSLGREGLS